MTESICLITLSPQENVRSARMAHAVFMPFESCLECSYLHQVVRRSDTNE
jgi:hypothetical protein